MGIIAKDIEDYACRHTTPAGNLLEEILAYTQAEVPVPQMLSGHLQGRFLAFLSKLLRPKRVLEIGTYTGYSALCLCEGLSPSGELITLDINAKIEPRVRAFFAKSDWAQQITYLIGDAKVLLPSISGPLDLVFIDADKLNYGLYYRLIVEKLRVGGVLIADNMLWSGKVLEHKKDKSTHALHAFNQEVQADERFSNLLLPVRDGLMIAVKNEITQKN